LWQEFGSELAKRSGALLSFSRPSYWSIHLGVDLPRGVAIKQIRFYPPSWWHWSCCDWRNQRHHAACSWRACSDRSAGQMVGTQNACRGGISRWIQTSLL